MRLWGVGMGREGVRMTIKKDNISKFFYFLTFGLHAVLLLRSMGYRQDIAASGLDSIINALPAVVSNYDRGKEGLHSLVTLLLKYQSHLSSFQIATTLSS